MAELARSHPTVRLRDLMVEASIGGLRSDGFADIEHLRDAKRARLVLEVLEPEICRALRRSRRHGRQAG